MTKREFLDTVFALAPNEANAIMDAFDAMDTQYNLPIGTDLISRQALLDKFEPWLKVKDYNDGELNMLKAILYEIRFMRSAEPKRGRWVLVCDNNGMHFICNKCGAWRYHQEQNFCGECGADMRGEQYG